MAAKHGDRAGEPIKCGHCMMDLLENKNEVDKFEEGTIIYD